MNNKNKNLCNIIEMLDNTFEESKKFHFFPNSINELSILQGINEMRKFYLDDKSLAPMILYNKDKILELFQSSKAFQKNKDCKIRHKSIFHVLYFNFKFSNFIEKKKEIEMELKKMYSEYKKKMDIEIIDDFSLMIVNEEELLKIYGDKENFKKFFLEIFKKCKKYGIPLDVGLNYEYGKVIDNEERMTLYLIDEVGESDTGIDDKPSFTLIK